MNRRLRKFILITGTTLCLLIVGAFVASGWFAVAVGTSPDGFWAVTHGAVTICTWKVRIYVDFEIAAHEFDLAEWNLWDVWDAGGLYVIPLYAPFLLIALPTLLVWRLAPKFPRGHCRRCGYNLKGLTEARCPECGTGFERG